MEVKNVPFSVLVEPLLRASGIISVVKGKGGRIDTPHEAWKKLFEGDEVKKPGDMAEVDELLEALAGSDVVEVMLEAADVAYYASKLTESKQVLDELGVMAGALGLGDIVGLMEVGMKKYGVRSELCAHLHRSELVQIEKQVMAGFVTEKGIGMQDVDVASARESLLRLREVARV